MLRVRTAVMAAVLVTTLASPTIACGAVAVYEGRGVGKARLGMTYTAMRTALGKPRASGRDSRYSGPTVYYYCYGVKMSNGLYPLKVYRKATVFTFETNSSAYVTTKNIRVGSTESYLKSRYGTALKRYPGSVYTRYQWDSNTHHTDFYTRFGRVQKIAVRL